MAAVRKLKELEGRLGYAFEDRALLKKALTHASVRQASAKRRDNERLEFLGDRVLGLAVAELLSELYPAANEGQLARVYNRLVRGGTCAEVARSLDLGPSLVLSESEASSGGRDKETILADACEALLGAIFLEAGYDKAREIVRKHWGARLEGSPAESPPTPSPPCRSGRRARASICRSTRRWRARAPTTRRASRPRCASRARSPRAARVPASAPPSRPPPRRCSRARAWSRPDE